jgi:hypothetical protein
MANLLRNPGFEGTPIIWENAGEVKIVPEWEPWHWDDLAGYPGISDGNLSSVHTARPEFRPATLDIDATRIHGGEQSQMWFSFYRNNYAGVFQRSIPVTVGSVYQASVWAQAWSSAKDDPKVSEAEIYLSIGINPRGDASLRARDTVWSQWQWIGAQWVQVHSQQVKMAANMATLFIASGTKYSVKHNDMYIDDAEFVVVESGATPEPEPEPGGPVDYAQIRAIIREEIDATRLSR